MDGWGVAATLFAAGAFALAALAEWRRWRDRPTWYWAGGTATRRDDPGLHRITLQLMADGPAHHVTVEGVGVELWHGHHDHDHDWESWPHLGMVSPSDPPLEIYVEEDGTDPRPHLLVTWAIPPMRAERFVAQRIAVGNEPSSEPHVLRGPQPWEAQWWRRRWMKLRAKVARRSGRTEPRKP